MDTEDNFYGVFPSELREAFGDSFTSPNSCKHRHNKAKDVEYDNTAVLSQSGIFTPLNVGHVVNVGKDSDFQ